MAEIQVMSLNLPGQRKTRQVVGQDEQCHGCDLKTG